MQLQIPHTKDAAKTHIPFRNLCDFCNTVAEHETSGARYCTRHYQEYQEQSKKEKTTR